MNNILKSGLIWSTIEVLIKRTSDFVVKMILARLLFPEDFGIIGMATVFISFIQVLNDGGMGLAIVQKKVILKKDNIPKIKKSSQKLFVSDLFSFLDYKFKDDLNNDDDLIGNSNLVIIKDKPTLVKNNIQKINGELKKIKTKFTHTKPQPQHFFNLSIFSIEAEISNSGKSLLMRIILSALSFLIPKLLERNCASNRCFT